MPNDRLQKIDQVVAYLNWDGAEQEGKFDEHTPSHEQEQSNAITSGSCFHFICRSWKTGAGEGIRTLDPNLGKVVLYH